MTMRERERERERESQSLWHKRLRYASVKLLLHYTAS